MFTSGAPDQRVATIASRAGTHRPIAARPVKPGPTLCSRPARVRRAQILLLERPAAHEGVAGVALGTGADRLVVGRLAGGALAAHVGVGLEAGVTALERDAGLVAGTVAVLGTLRVASGHIKDDRQGTNICNIINYLNMGGLG